MTNQFGAVRMSRAISLVAGLVCATGLFVSASSAEPVSIRGATEKGISPETYAEVSSGVALIKTFTCKGKPLASGTGFLVGSQVLMTARHVIVGAKGVCIVRAYMGNNAYTAAFVKLWRSSPTNETSVDIATMKLSRPATNRFVFSFAQRTPPAHTTIAMIGHPLGNPLALAQGPLIFARTIGGLPQVAISLATAQGSSGSPLLDPSGDVIGILQRGFVRDSAGLVLGLNLTKWWGQRQALRDLCRAYPLGGIPDCGASPPPPVDSAPVTVTDAYLTWTDESDLPVAAFLTNAPFTIYLKLKFDAPVRGNHTYRVDTIAPDGQRDLQCSSQLGGGLSRETCEIDLGNFPVAGQWAAVYSIDGKQQGTVSFQIVASAPAVTVTDAYLNQSTDGTDRQTVFQHATGSLLYVHLVFSAPLATPHTLRVDFIRPDGLGWSYCSGTLQAGWAGVWCSSNASETTYVGTWTVRYSIDSQPGGTLTFTLQ